mgnify:CR=1 FL=1
MGKMNSIILILYITVAVIALYVFVYIMVNKKITYDVLSAVNDALLPPEDLQKHAMDIARTHNYVKYGSGSKFLFGRIKNNFQVITRAKDILNDDENMDFSSVPSAEWLLDNYYIIEEQVRDIRSIIQKGHLSRLPLISKGTLAGVPRIYAAVADLVSHTDGKVDEKTLISFFKAYQKQCVLLMRELWSSGTMLRIAIIENIRGLCEKIMSSHIKWKHAEEFAAYLEKYKDISDEDFIKMLNSFDEGNNNISSPAFVEHLVHMVRKKGIKPKIVIEWINDKLQDKGLNVDTVASSEHQLQASMQVSMGNAVTTLRSISNMDWNDIFEQLSHAEMILRADPSGVYAKMDFESRDYYRHRIENIAKRNNISEILVARKLIECCVKSTRNNKHNLFPASHHIGFYLFGEGYEHLENVLGKNRKVINRIYSFIKKKRFEIYVFLIAAALSIILLCFATYAYTRAMTYKAVMSVVAAAICLIPCSELAITFINTMANLIFLPSLLPKMELSEGISEEMSTMVVVPTLLSSAQRVEELVSQLEIIYLSNRESNIYFAILGDLKDSSVEENAEDADILNAGMKGIDELNRKYSKDKKIFYFFLRKRKYNKNQNRWLGWERKRGAIMEFNDLLRGCGSEDFGFASCAREEMPYIKYVITLDADTILPIGTARKLVGAIEHPLNKALIDDYTNTVKKGYGLLQPRVGINILSANKSIFTRIFAGQAGIDPYSCAVSDIYQDLFGEGIFTGKGIYEVDVFRKVLADAIPENSVLSHDLLEGSYVRTGLVSDIEVIDGYPARYNSYMMRLHRWIRGDWQLLPWLFGKIKNRNNQKIQNPLNALSKWKIFDNLRRSLVSPSVLLLVFFSFTFLPGKWFVWMLLALFTVATPLVSYAIAQLFSGSPRTGRERTYSTLVCGARGAIIQAGLLLAFVPYSAYISMDAIIRTLWRLLFTRKNLLEWVTAADMEASLKNSAASFYKRMWVCILCGFAVIVLSLINNDYAWIAGLVIGTAWIAAPYVAYDISKSIKQKTILLPESDNKKLRLIARKTWRYFEDFVTAYDNYLPPDNYQEEPAKGVAHRTSPTNIGLLFLSILSARDLGFLTTEKMFQLIDRTLSTVEKMKKWRGHLYNWYNTVTLEVLRPRYVSTVDSGNFVGYLMVVAEGIREYSTQTCMLDKKLLQGLETLILLLDEEVSLSEEEKTGIENLINNQTLIDCNDTAKLTEFLTCINSWLESIPEDKAEKSYWHKKIKTHIQDIFHEINNVENYSNDKYLAQAEQLISRINQIISNMEFKPLFDNKMQLFSIGYNVEEGHLTKSYYDLLASEARQASFIAVAKGEIDKKHWFRLGRKLVRLDGYKGLVSWTGTMFEYMMPPIIMKNFENTLLDETYHFVIRNQKRLGELKDVPWGISESAYNVFDINLNYQYKAFGLAELGLKRGLENDLVIAPYATFLALPFYPSDCINNIKRMEQIGAQGNYGFYEALDFTPSRLRDDENMGIVKSYMVHHQGMSLASINNLLNNFILQTRFHAIPAIKAAETLLQERVPRKVVFKKEFKVKQKPKKKSVVEMGELVRIIEKPCQSLPYVHIITNGDYSVMLTDKGTGYSKYNGIAVNRWHASTSMVGGNFIYVQNINSNTYWSATYEPNVSEPEDYKVIFSPDKAEYLRRDGNIETHLQITVAPDDQVEVRKVTLTNNSSHTRILEITSYFEIVLANPEDDLAHPAFSNLFVRTEYLPQYNCIIASRRPRIEGKKTIYGMHCVSSDTDFMGDIQYETDRFRFIGRNRSVFDPAAMEPDVPLSNSSGAVLDPIMSLRVRVKLEPGRTSSVAFITGIAENRTIVNELAAKYRLFDSVGRAFDLSWTRNQIETKYFGFTVKETEQFLSLLRAVLFVSPLRRLVSDIMSKNKKGQDGLWAYGISGDLPIVAAIVQDRDDIGLVEWALRAHEYWRIKGVKTDLVFIIQDEGSYTQPLRELVTDTIISSHEREVLNIRGGVFILSSDAMPEEDRILFSTVASIIIKDNPEQICKMLDECSRYPENRMYAGIKELENNKTKTVYTRKMMNKELRYFNGIGGFGSKADKYIIILRENQTTPLPWCNVVSNGKFGFLTSESSMGFVWSENSRENKLTPWSNDPVSDYPSEVMYLRNDKTGEYWSVTPMPVRQKEDYMIIHTYGYTVYEHESCGLRQHLLVYTASNDAVKINMLKIYNTEDEEKDISIFYYAKPVLGVSDKKTSPFIVSEYDTDNKVLLLMNAYNAAFQGRVMFIDCSEDEISYTANEAEFVGYGETLSEPNAMYYDKLSNTSGTGYDPCAAIQVKIKIKPKERKKIVFLLGQGKTRQEAISLATRYKNINLCVEEFVKVKQNWSEILDKIQVNTPDDSMDILLNGWLLYQVISCRLWARSAFYQSGGAFGFRDQLQDVMALVYTRPDIARNQILLHASRQYVEGDVQHWWHNEEGKGIRTRYSDDLLWLPYVTADYIENTQDYSILHEIAGYLESPPLKDGEDERYEVPIISAQRSNIYEHCIRAIERALKFGEHGIPLMGSGDWNDGMNTVGNKGKGESVWLGWFLYAVLDKFKEICRYMNDNNRYEKYTAVMQEIAKSIENSAWDGSWYRRAFFDDGKPLGSAQNAECKIDSISQSWAAISGAGKPARIKEAMKAVENYLVDRDENIIKLLTPPFDSSDIEPGYIKGYVPGVRENGGQYTHAAVWVVLAFAKMGMGDKAHELYHMINPVNHSRTQLECWRYKTEPYVMCADVYAIHPHEGRGGWSWYTGAAGWMYRVGMEHMLGIKKRGNMIYVDPCIPKEWDEYEVKYQYGSSVYNICIKNPNGVSKGVKSICIDGKIIEGNSFMLENDGAQHAVHVEMG